MDLVRYIGTGAAPSFRTGSCEGGGGGGCRGGQLSIRLSFSKLKKGGGSKARGGGLPPRHY